MFACLIACQILTGYLITKFNSFVNGYDNYKHFLMITINIFNVALYFTKFTFLFVWMYCYILIYAYTSIYMQNHNDTIIKQTSEDFFRKICTSHFIVRVRKGLLRVLL